MEQKKTKHTPPTFTSASAIAVQPDTYTPMVDDEGNYVDKVPSNGVFATTGIRCPCSTRRDKVYNTKSSFTTHTKSQGHQAWLKEMSSTKTDYRTIAQEQEEIIKAQKIMIAQMERAHTAKNLETELEIQNMRTTIQMLMRVGSTNLANSTISTSQKQDAETQTDEMEHQAVLFFA